MSDSGGIEWTDATWNPVGGCSVHSPGCTNCYAMKLAGTRLMHHPLYAGTTKRSKAGPVFNGHLTVSPEGSPVWGFPRRWRGSKAPRMGTGKPSLIFIGDMSDVFHKDRDADDVGRIIGAFGDAVSASPVGAGRSHIGQLLTKRPEIMASFFHAFKVAKLPWQPTRHLWLGFSAEDQQRFDERWPYMRYLAAMGFVVFVSYEPALGPLVLPKDFLALAGRAWVIAGAESGRSAREFDTSWFGGINIQCAEAGVPFFMKQITVDGRKVPIEGWPLLLRVRKFPEVG